MKSLLEALDDDQNPKEVKESAIRTLGAIGQVDLVVPLLSRQGDHVSRQAAIRTLRWLKGQSAEQARAVNENVRQFFGKALGDTVIKLLDGHSPQEAREESTYSKLVLQLTAGDPAVRELAVENLMTLTGRDDLGYDPDMAEGAGLKQWQDLLRRNELRPKAPVLPKPNAR
jgi:HEAT repeat protein